MDIQNLFDQQPVRNWSATKGKFFLCYIFHKEFYIEDLIPVGAGLVHSCYHYQWAGEKTTG